MLSQSRYTARIAVWVDRVRLHRSGPQGERTRIASCILFDKLAWSIEAGAIDSDGTPILAVGRGYSRPGADAIAHEHAAQ